MIVGSAGKLVHTNFEVIQFELQDLFEDMEKKSNFIIIVSYLWKIKPFTTLLIWSLSFKEIFHNALVNCGSKSPIVCLTYSFQVSKMLILVEYEIYELGHLHEFFSEVGWMVHKNIYASLNVEHWNFMHIHTTHHHRKADGFQSGWNVLKCFIWLIEVVSKFVLKFVYRCRNSKIV